MKTLLTAVLLLLSACSTKSEKPTTDQMVTAICNHIEGLARFDNIHNKRVIDLSPDSKLHNEFWAKCTSTYTERAKVVEKVSGPFVLENFYICVMVSPDIPRLLACEEPFTHMYEIGGGK